MRPSVLLACAGAFLLVCAGVAGCDLTLGGNPDALIGVIGASVSAVVCAILSWIARRFEEE